MAHHTTTRPTRRPNPGEGTRHPGRQETALLSVALLGTWVLLSGKLDAVHLTMGVLSVGLVMGLNRALFRTQLYPGDVYRRLRLWRLTRYVLWLAWETVKAAIQVAGIILRPKTKVAPLLVRFKAELPSAGAQMLLANSITLTPGTLTLDINGDELLVHALSRDTCEGLCDGTLVMRVAALYDGPETGRVSEVTFPRPAPEE